MEELMTERREALPMQTRAQRFESVNEAERTIEVVWTTGAAVERKNAWTGETFIEELEVSQQAIRLGRLQAGAPFLDNHGTYSNSAAIGVVERVWLTNAGEGRAVIRFFSAKANPVAEMRFQQVIEGHRGVSVGYVVKKFRKIERDGAPTIYRAVDWEPHEISLVTVGADAAAGVRSAENAEKFECVIMERALPGKDVAMATEDNTGTEKPEVKTETRAEAASVAVDVSAFRKQGKLSRLTDAETIDAIERAYRGELTLDAWRDEIFNKLAEADEKKVTQRAVVLRDETDVRRNAVQGAMTYFLRHGHNGSFSNGKRIELSGPEEQYKGARGVWEMAAAYLGDVPTIGNGYGSARYIDDVLSRAMATSDFPTLMAASINSALAARYMAAEPVYRQLARRRTYKDFRDHETITVAASSTMKLLKEGAPITFSSAAESKEKSKAVTYAEGMLFTRQLIVNDPFDAMAQLLAEKVDDIPGLEDGLFFALLTSGSSSNGPTLNETSRQMFNTTDVTLAATPADLTTSNITIGWQAMVGKTKPNGEPITADPAILLTASAKYPKALQETMALQPTQASAVPIYTYLKPLLSKRLTGNVWYLFADPARGANFEYGFLEGYETPRVESEVRFEYDGIATRLIHDFGVGAINYRYAWKNAGA